MSTLVKVFVFVAMCCFSVCVVLFACDVLLAIGRVGDVFDQTGSKLYITANYGPQMLIWYRQHWYGLPVSCALSLISITAFLMVVIFGKHSPQERRVGARMLVICIGINVMASLALFFARHYVDWLYTWSE
jgi:hypothetical protein